MSDLGDILVDEEYLNSVNTGDMELSCSLPSLPDPHESQHASADANEAQEDNIGQKEGDKETEKCDGDVFVRSTGHS
ncbi:unnamed protein product [Peronospora destructor]|uniref:Uncharacterized protein n=1 Tax=Peronospora destructor TaxID=86335 RepID=A0AAV0U7I4_9STRA|nr:unnamed protein product [Peronospora destructor]